MMRAIRLIIRPGNQPTFCCSECDWIFPALTTGKVEKVSDARQFAEHAFQRHRCEDYKLNPPSSSASAA